MTNPTPSAPQPPATHTRWYCESCQRTGVLPNKALESVYTALRAGQDAHRAASPSCAFDLGKMRVMETIE